MGQVSASSSIDIAAPAATVLEAVADYVDVRPAILPDNYRDYRVDAGGQGQGTVVHWILQATEKRSRDVLAEVTVNGNSVVEKDRNSSMVTVYTVTEQGAGSVVEVTTSWQGAGGIGGFFEKTFAPKGLARIQGALLSNLKSRIEA